ncbi:LysR family transcriptional regulator [Thiorhodococcus minor]|uniref:LysR family transcriptional regulator n=1 Tax=Thiorhodococcus minor TaxID=57489 RepID=A0A6M0K6L3_9GAMM|nr:LysR family transcriptional regulator [Thiorhodococcus minor]
MASPEGCAVGGVTRAAERLALSQSAVSHKVKRLEAGLGCDLLSRRAGAPLFTTEGERLLRYARRLVALHDEAVLSLGQQPLTGQIRLGMTEDTSGGGLARILGRFTRRHPDVAVQTPVSQSLAIAAQLEHGELDIGILQLFAHRARPSDRILARDSLHWVKSPDLRLDLSRQVPFLPFDDNCFYRHWTMEVGQSQPPGLASVLTCPSGAGILCALHAGLGVRLLSTRQITPEMEGLSEPLPPPPEVAQIVRIGSGAGASAVRALVDEIATELGQPTTAQAA